MVAIAGLARRARWGIAATWLFDVWGTADLLFAIADGNVQQIAPGFPGAAFFIPTFLVPGLLVIHLLGFRVLLRRAPAGPATP